MASFQVTAERLKELKLTTAASKLPTSRRDLDDYPRLLLDSDMENCNRIMKDLDKVIAFAKKSAVTGFFIPSLESAYQTGRKNLYTYRQMEKPLGEGKIDFRNLFSVAFDYACLKYFKRHIKDGLDDDVTLALIMRRDEVINYPNKTSENCDNFEMHIDSVMSNLITSKTNATRADALASYNYFIHANLYRLDTQIVSDQRSIFNAMAKNDGDAFCKVMTDK